MPTVDPKPLPPDADKFIGETWTIVRKPPKKPKEPVKKLRVYWLGSAESGNYGHAGRPGQVGGSAPASGFASSPRVFNTLDDVGTYTSWGETKWEWRKDGKGTGALLTGEPIPRETLPDELYHVTTNAPAVLSSGVLLGQRSDAGLGGGQADGVSFTTSKVDARVIQRELVRSVKIARGDDIGMDAIERYAAEDEKEAGLAPGTLKSAVGSARTGYDGNKFLLEKAYVKGEGYTDTPPTPAERERIHRSITKDALNAYLNGRQYASGEAGKLEILKNPILFGRQEQLAKINPKDIQTLTVPAKNIPATALVTTGSDKFLHEVRAYSDVPTPNTTAQHLAERTHLLAFVLRGTESSGNYGHRGRPGQKGGSAPSGTVPDVVYHGTNVPNIGKFEPTYGVVTAWFTEHEGLARQYADVKTQFKGGKATVYPAKLTITKPIVINGDMNAKTTYREERERTGLSFTIGKYGDEIVEGVEQRYTRYEIVTSPEFVDAAKAKGYDGIKVMEGGHPTWGVFSADQIRTSAARGITPDERLVARQAARESAERQRKGMNLRGTESSGNYGHAGRPGQVGGSAPGGGGSSTSGRNIDSPQFKRWFKDSAVVDDDGDPLRVYHGTTFDIGEFREAGAEGLNPESDWGAGVYFTSDPEDASENYAGEGPDLTGKLEARAEELESNEEMSREDAMAQAREELSGHSVSVVPVYISMQTPFVLGEPNGSSSTDETRLEMEYVYDNPDDPDSDIVDQKGTLVDFFSSLRDESRQYQDADDAIDEFTQKVGEYGESITASQLVKLWKDTEKTNYISNDEGKLVQSELFRAALEHAGFDGVIDRTVNDKFGKYGEQRGGRGGGMEHLNEDTTHFIAFKPTQIKSATGNKMFDPKNPAITMRRPDGEIVLLALDGSGYWHLGSAASGNYGHAGRPGQKGGSAPGMTVRVNGRDIQVVKSKYANRVGETLVAIDIPTFDAAWSRQRDFYLDPHGSNRIGNRYERIAEWMQTTDHIDASEVTVQKDGRVDFTDGRHRMAYLRDQGVKRLPVTMTKESLKNAEKFGILAPVLPIESNEPRDTMTANDVGALLASQHNQVQKREAEKEMGATANTTRYEAPFLQDKFVKSGTFRKMEIPIDAASPIGNVHPGATSKSTGPIVVDANKGSFGRGMYGAPPRLVVLDGKHRLAEAKARGAKTITAYVGDEAVQHLPKRTDLRGTESSGNYGHAGRPGERGGSAPSGGRTDTPAFKAWFNDSKVVDDDGQPLVLYHGTSHDVEQFDPEKAMTSNIHSLTLGVPLYFAVNKPQIAETYTYDAPGANVMPLYMSLQKPLIVDVGGNDFTEAATRIQDELPIYRNAAGERFAEYRDKLIDRFGDEEWEQNDIKDLLTPDEHSTLMALQRAADKDSSIDRRISKQYDGIIIKNVIDQAHFGEGTHIGDVYVAFKPEQIKSAIGNKGTFDPTNPKITMSYREKLELLSLGGEGSGNFDHVGRPGEVGGSGPGGGAVAAKVAEAADVIADAKADGRQVLFHSGDASIDNDLAEGIEPRFGDWLEEVLSGATDEDSLADEIRERDPVTFFSTEPNWVAMKTARKLDKFVGDVTLDDIRQHGQLSIISVAARDPSTRFTEAEQDAMTEQEWQHHESLTEKGADPDDFLTTGGKYHEEVVPLGGKSRGYEEIPFGVEPNDIFSKTTVVPDVTLTGDALVEFLETHYPESLPKQRRALGSDKSGNFGHLGRPGEQGGSAPGTGHATTLHKVGSSVQLPGRYDKTKVPPNTVVATTKNGYIIASKAADAEHLWINHIWVSDKAQGKGEGTALVIAAFKAAQKQGLKGVLDGYLPGRDISADSKRLWASLERKGLTERVTSTSNGKPYETNALVRVPAEPKHLGGAGSGNFGHEGRPGEVGGSASGDTAALTDRQKDKAFSDMLAKARAKLERKAAVEARPHGEYAHNKATWEEVHGRIAELVPNVLIVESKQTTLTAASHVADVLEDMHRQGYTMPTSILIETTDKHESPYGSVTFAKSKDGTAQFLTPDRLDLTILIPAALPDAANLDDAVEVGFGGQKEIGGVAYDRFAVRTMNDVVIHEMGHIQAGHRGDKIPGSTKLITGTGRPTPEAASIVAAARSVSMYASTSEDEFMACSFVRLYRGEKLSPASQKLYDALKGPKVKR